MNADMKWLDNPEVFRVNQLDAHSDHCYYMDYADMEKSENPLMQSLNGQWEFAFSKNVMDRPENFYEENFDASSFDKIMVPGHIELAGYDKIRYINTMYPWEGKEYHRGAYSMESTGDEAGMFSEAEYNPVGSYIKRFDLSEQMREKKIRICFEGVEEAMYLWLNGQFVGYAEDSFTPSEFDLTPFIREKGNVLAVQVHKMSTAAFLEDQDFFRFFGIFRNVTLKAVPEVHLEDVWFQPTLNKDNISGRVRVEARGIEKSTKKRKKNLFICPYCGRKLMNSSAVCTPKLLCPKRRMVRTGECQQIFMLKSEAQDKVLEITKEICRTLIQEEELKRASKDKRKVTSDEYLISELKAEYDRISNSTVSCYQSYREGKYTKEEYVQLRKTNQELLADLENQISDLQEKAANQEPDTEEKIEQLTQYSMLEQYDGDVLSNIIDKVLIYNDKDIEVVFKGENFIRNAV